VFALVPLHVANIGAALPRANHIREAFGKGIMPRGKLSRDVLVDAKDISELRTRRPNMCSAGSSGPLREDRDERFSLNAFGPNSPRRYHSMAVAAMIVQAILPQPLCCATQPQ
jgi:hypothetical protein